MTNQPKEQGKRLTISIGLKPSILEAIARISTLIGSAIAIPVINELILNGHWSINLIGAAFGTMAAVVAFGSSLPTSRRFLSKEDAAEWVRSGEWDQP